MRYRLMGKTGIRVSEIGFGAWALGGPALLGNKPFGYGSIDEKECRRALEAAIEDGVTFIDTADVYGLGHSERLVGQAIKGKRDKLVVATKGGSVPDNDQEWLVDCSYHHLIAAADRSLQRLDTDYIDLYQLHSPPEQVPWDGVYKAFDDLKRQGKIRAAGVSTSYLRQGEELAKSGQVDTIQVIYNLLAQEPAKTLIPKAKKRGVGIIARVPLAYGLLAGKYTAETAFAPDDWRSRWGRAYLEEQLRHVEQLKFLIEPPARTASQAALAFVLSEPGISTVIPGIKNVKQLKDAVDCVEYGPLPEKNLEKAKSLYQRWGGQS